jgi:hypothetical protein
MEATPLHRKRRESPLVVVPNRRYRDNVVELFLYVEKCGGSFAYENN